MAKMMDLFDSARRVSVPILMIRSADQIATVETIAKTGDAYPFVQWDAARGITPKNDKGRATLVLLSAQANSGQVISSDKETRERELLRLFAQSTIGWVEAMLAIQSLPQGSVVFAHNAHRQLMGLDSMATAAAVQAVANLREPFKSNFRMLVPLSPVGTTVPPELDQDVVTIDDELPGAEALGVIITDLYKAVKPALELPDASVLTKAVEAISGLSAFGAEQVSAMSFVTKGKVRGLDIDAMWDRKAVQIEQADGLGVYRGKETLADLRGLDNVTARVRAHKTARTPVGVVVWVDEGADVFSNVEQDTSGVKTDQQRALLVEMEQNNWRGMIFVGVPGSGKSAVARAFGNEIGAPTISIDFGAMESRYVGDSEAKLRHAIHVIKAVGNGNAFFVLTCNSLKGIRPQFMRRFRRGTFFFDLPTKPERDAIWQLYLGKYNLDVKQERPNDEGWTGAEIRECVESAWDMKTSLVEAAHYIIPVARSRWTEIENMRKEANGRFLDASRRGTYSYDPEPMKKHVRAIQLPPLPPDVITKIVDMEES